MMLFITKLSDIIVNQCRLKKYYDRHYLTIFISILFLFMATYFISRRIQFLIQYIFDEKFPSKNQILNFLKDKDFNISARTLERDIDRIKTDFGLEIGYNKVENGYYIDEEKSVKVDSFFKFLELVTLADIFSNSLQDSSKILEHVSFDDSKSFKGISNIKLILMAITNNREISFTHENFENKTLKSYKIVPFLIKEYENRWYVIGVPDKQQQIRTFGIDRISDLKVNSSTKLRKHKFIKQLNGFENIIGLSLDKSEPVKIQLLINEVHLKYLESLPLHHSQMIYPKNDNGRYMVQYKLIPNYEFKTQILKMGEDALVIEPDDLKGEIKQMLLNTLSRYND